MAEVKRAPRPEAVEQVLPLVIEIIPGQAGEGLIDVYEPGSYEGLSLRKLCEKTLSKTQWSIEEQQIFDDIKRQLDGGRLLCKGGQIDRTVLEYTVLEETERGEKYLYAAVRALKPQEGGFLSDEVSFGQARPGRGNQDGEARTKGVGSELPKMPGRATTTS